MKGDATVDLNFRVSFPPTEPWPSRPRYELNTTNPVVNRLMRKGPDRGPVEYAHSTCLEQYLDEFLHVYAHRPDPANACGGRLNHQFALYCITKIMKPETIIESGVYAGQSTYILRQAAGPETNIISLDPYQTPVCTSRPTDARPGATEKDLDRWVDPTDNNEYLTGPTNFVDFGQVDWSARIAKGDLNPDTTLILIDDHQGVYPGRFHAFLKHGFTKVVYDDNLQMGWGMLEGDMVGDTPKQMWRHANSDASQWLFNKALVRYAEFPPVLSPRLTQATGWRKEPGFLYHTDDFRHIEKPLVQPELHNAFEDDSSKNTMKEFMTKDMMLTKKIFSALGIPTLYRHDFGDFYELFSYSFICYMELNPKATIPPPPL